MNRSGFPVCSYRHQLYMDPEWEYWESRKTLFRSGICRYLIFMITLAAKGLSSTHLLCYQLTSPIFCFSINRVRKIMICSVSLSRDWFALSDSMPSITPAQDVGMSGGGEGEKLWAIWREPTKGTQWKKEGCFIWEEKGTEQRGERW